MKRQTVAAVLTACALAAAAACSEDVAELGSGADAGGDAARAGDGAVTTADGGSSSGSTGDASPKPTGDASPTPGDASPTEDATVIVDAAVIEDASTSDATTTVTCQADSCHGHGVCIDATGVIVCACAPEYSGATCDTCAAGFQDGDGDKTCTASCTATTCSGHGTCADTTGTAVCTCDVGFNPPTCSGCPAGTQDNDNDTVCSPACSATTCNSHGTCADTTGTAVCTCATGYTGAACATCAAGYQDNDTNQTCSLACAPTTCSSHGTCADTTGTAVCACTGHFAGANCSTCTAGFSGANCDVCAAGFSGPNCDFKIVYGLNIPLAATWSSVGARPVYSVDNSLTTLAPFTRIAYRMTLDTESVWVEMDAFTNTSLKIGVPVADVFDQVVNNVTIVSSSPKVGSISAPLPGYIEFWSNCYGPAGGNSGLYDYKDTFTGTNCYGSMQVHVGTTTIFAYNRWANAGNSDIGFGNQPTGHPDWTYAQTTGLYTTRKLEVFVK